MLKGNNVNLRVLERSDLPLLHTWTNDVDFVGQFEPFDQKNMSQVEKEFDQSGSAPLFLIEQRKGTKVGFIGHFGAHGGKGIGYMLQPDHRRKGYGTEAVQIMVDYLFLHHNIVRVQAETHPDNVASQRVLQKAGFTKEGLIRRSLFSRGVYRDVAMWSILRDEWITPKILPLGYVKP